VSPLVSKSTISTTDGAEATLIANQKFTLHSEASGVFIRVVSLQHGQPTDQSGMMRVL